MIMIRTPEEKVEDLSGAVGRKAFSMARIFGQILLVSHELFFGYFVSPVVLKLGGNESLKVE